MVAIDKRINAGDGQDLKVDALLEQVGTRVLTARKAAGLARRELAEISGVSMRYLAQLEAGEGNVSLAILKRISLALDVPVDAFLRSDDQMSQEATRISALYRTADPATRTRVAQILDPDHSRAAKASRICLIGLRGAGKSTLGALIAKDLGMRFVELNQEIERAAGVPVREVFSLYGEDGYRDLEAETIDKLVTEQTRIVLAASGGIVLNTETFSGVLSRFHPIWLKAQPSDHMERVRGQGDTRPMEGNPQAMVQLRQILKTREAQYSKAPFHLETSGKTIEESHADLLELLRSNEIS